MPDPVRPGRDSDSLADVVELLLDKGVVLNADIVVSVGETELLGIRLRAALASFETASEFGLEFPSGTDMEAVEAASKRRRRAKMSPAARPGLEDEEEGDGNGDEDREDRSVDVMNATIGEAEDERSADEGGGDGEAGEADGGEDAEDDTDTENDADETAQGEDRGEDGGDG